MANDAEGWTPVEESASPEEPAGWTPAEATPSQEPHAQPYSPRDSFIAGVKDFPAALFSMGSTPSYEEFVKRTGGDMYRAMGLVTAAAAAGYGANKFQASRAAAHAAPRPSAPPEAPSGYTVSSTTPKADAFYKPAAPGGPGTPPTAAPTVGRVGKALGHVTPITRMVSLLPGLGRIHPIAEYLKMAAEHWGWAEGGTVLDRLPDRTAILESLRR